MILRPLPKWVWTELDSLVAVGIRCREPWVVSSNVQAIQCMVSCDGHTVLSSGKAGAESMGRGDLRTCRAWGPKLKKISRILSIVGVRPV